MTHELLPCPFCGGKAHISREGDPDGFGGFYTVKCGTCAAETGPRFASTGNECPQFYAEVRDEWNRRAHLQHLPLTGREGAEQPLHKNHLPDLRYVLRVLEGAHVPEHQQGNVEAAITGMRYIIKRTEEAARAPSTDKEGGGEGGADGVMASGEAQRLVPVKPTAAMLEAGAMRVAMNMQFVGTAEAKAEMVWRDMVAAAGVEGRSNG